MTDKFEKPGILQRPGPIGRAVRIVFGIGATYFLTEVLTSYSGIVRVGLPRSISLFFGIVFTFYFLPDVINIGFTRRWGRKPQLVVIVLAVTAAVFDQVHYGFFWGPELGLLVFVLLAYVLTHLSLSFILAGIL